MNISTELKDEHIDSGKPDGGYEWWYFDAISLDQEWAMVIIFYQGNPFSPRYIKGLHGNNPEGYPALSVSIYRKGKPEFYSFLEYPEKKFSGEEEPFSCAIGSNVFRRESKNGQLVYEILLNHKLDSGHSINGKLKFVSPCLDSPAIESINESEKHYWNLIQPRAKVAGSVKIEGKNGRYHIGFHGNGYHDHNTGHEPLKESFREWYWGRFHFAESTLIYYIMQKKKGKQHHAWLINKENQQIMEEFSDIEMQAEARSIFGLKSFQKVILKSGDSEITIQQSKRIDNGPFYQRYLSDSVMKRKDQLYSAQGITEFIFPSAIYEERFWWMVKMRLRFLREKPHWVQKSGLMYPWTW